MIELTFLKELILIKKVHHNSVMFTTIAIFYIIVLKFQPNAYSRCHALLITSMNLSNIAILNIKGSDYYCIVSLISKNEAINLMQNVNLTEKNQNITKPNSKSNVKFVNLLQILN